MGGEGTKQLSKVTILLIPVDVTQEHAMYEKSRSCPHGLNSPFLVQLILQKKSGKFNYEIADTGEKA